MITLKINWKISIKFRLSILLIGKNKIKEIKNSINRYRQLISNIKLRSLYISIIIYQYIIDQLRSRCMEQNILAQDELRYCYIFNVKQNNIFICNFVFKIN